MQGAFSTCTPLQTEPRSTNSAVLHRLSTTCRRLCKLTPEHPHPSLPTPGPHRHTLPDHDRPRQALPHG
eukprot:363378-Chlamydomonas_euryale.AAC.30